MGGATGRENSSVHRFPPIGRYVVTHRDARLVRRVAGLCRRFLAWYENECHDPWTNGERFVLDAVAAAEPACIFDVGANVGGWTEMARLRCPSAEVHAFEISPPTLASLRDRTAGDRMVRCVATGLSDAPGTVRLRHFPDHPELTTASDFPHAATAEEIEAPVTTGDRYAEEAAIDRIDLLKIDVEGMEHRVLAGFEALFARGAVQTVQFEYGRVNILSGHLLRDFSAFFESHGFVLGKIFPDHVDFRPYSLVDEDFRGPNYLACRAARDDLIEVLGGRGAAC